MNHKPSVQNWLNLMGKGIIDNNMVMILDFVKNHPNCDIDDMRVDLNISHQSLTAGLSMVMDEGLIKFNGERERKGIKYSRLLFVDGTFNQMRERELRKRERYLHWLKKGLEEYADLMGTQLLMSLTIEKSGYEK